MAQLNCSDQVRETAWLYLYAKQMVVRVLAVAETSIIQPPPNQERSFAAFLREKESFDTMVAELQRMSDEHFGTDPDGALWGAVGDLQHWNSLLARVTDAYHRRGDFAA